MSADQINRVDPQLLDSAADEVRRRNVPGTPFQPLLKGRVLEAPPPAASRHAPSVEVRHLAQLAESGGWNTPQIGDMPPQPDTLRGRVGAVLVAMVRRMLFWYTGQLREFHGLVRDAAREQVSVLQQMAAEQQQQAAALANAVASVCNDERWKTMAAQKERLDRFEQSLNSRVRALEEARNGDAQELRREAENLREQVAAAGIPNAPAILRSQQEMGARLAALEAQITALEQELASELHTAIPALRRRRATEWRMSLDTLFTEHASIFRGHPDDIRSRLSIYTPYAISAYAAAGRMPATDLASGRGEWLDILKENGIDARGIDANENLVTLCRSRGLNVSDGDLIEYLQSLPSNSQSIVTGFHIVEHLPLPDLLELLDQTHRVLNPGGIAIFETPRPRNLLTAAHNFYLDPTHRNPLPTELLVFLIEARGLKPVETKALHPYPDEARLSGVDCPAIQFINENFYGPQDYGVIARKQ